ncbi:MAG: hypothetical protein IJQ85_07330 [Selenomonadaceae bacterium]|nr:hypothetical protein [Selenomonadaceae bacterium]
MLSNAGIDINTYANENYITSYSGKNASNSLNEVGGAGTEIDHDYKPSPVVETFRLAKFCRHGLS